MGVGILSRKAAEQAKRKWLLFLIFAPGIFFIVYWFMIQSAPNITSDKVKLPAEYVDLGKEIVANGKSYKALSGDKVFTDTVHLENNNVAVVDPGRIFMGLALETTADITRQDVQVIDEKGSIYSPLNVDKSVVAGNFGLSGDGVNMFLFKVSASSEFYYFQVIDNSKLTWRVVNDYK